MLSSLFKGLFVLTSIHSPVFPNPLPPCDCPKNLHAYVRIWHGCNIPASATVNIFYQHKKNKGMHSLLSPLVY
nr:hypothetical protein [Escherichia coli]